MTDAQELKPCPFCGGEATYSHDGPPANRWWTAKCTNCRAEVSLCNCEAEAARDWNTRADLSALVTSFHSKVTDEMVETATMELLGHTERGGDLAPNCDWKVDRCWTINGVRNQMRKALTLALEQSVYTRSDPRIAELEAERDRLRVAAKAMVGTLIKISDEGALNGGDWAGRKASNAIDAHRTALEGESK